MAANKGFSLLEILVILIIVGLFAAMVSHNFTGSIEQTRAQAARNNLLAIAAAQTKFNEDYSSNCTNYNIAACYCVNNATIINPMTGAPSTSMRRYNGSSQC